MFVKDVFGNVVTGRLTVNDSGWSAVSAGNYLLLPEFTEIAPYALVRATFA